MAFFLFFLGGNGRADKIATHFSIYRRSVNICPVHSWSALFFLSVLDMPLTADWLQVCFGTWSDTVVKSVFKILLSAPLNNASQKGICQNLHLCQGY